MRLSLDYNKGECYIIDVEAEMSESNGKKGMFLGTYFERDGVLRLSRWAEITSWIVLTIYLVTWLFSLVLFITQLSGGLIIDKGMNFVSLFSIFKPYFVEPIPGVLYFFGFQGISKILLIMLDVEDNTRRAARK